MNIKSLLTKINNDIWYQDLWVQLNNACNDSSDSEAIKSINKLALRWSHIDQQTKQIINDTFIDICGYTFDSLIEQTV
jgi:hypothetical protein